MSVRSPSLDVDGSGAESIFGSGGIGGFAAIVLEPPSACSSLSPPPHSPSTYQHVHAVAATSPPISETCPPRSRRGDDVEAGIDDATLEAFTAVVYSCDSIAAATQTCCFVCLENYGDADVLCVLPNSGNLFQLTPLVKVTPLSLGIALS
uniref:Uncharacterized protein n=1 Tax=Oryza barthii TaxID=65489 RepID=A0A0D3GHK2_9ORYZ